MVREKHIDEGNRVAIIKPMNGAVTTLDLGNNETVSRGVFPQTDGTFLAMTFTQSKTFKTLAGAAKWFARKAGK